MLIYISKSLVFLYNVEKEVKFAHLSRFNFLFVFTYLILYMPRAPPCRFENSSRQEESKVNIEDNKKIFEVDGNKLIADF